MKKKLIRLLIMYFLVAFMSYIGMYSFFSFKRGQEFDVNVIVFKSVMPAVILSSFVAFSWSIVYPVFPRAKYLDKNDSSKPSFKIACSSLVSIPQDLDFNRLKTEIADKWMITFSDDNEHELKFRSKMNFFTNMMGAAAWLKLDGNAGKITLEYFPLQGIQDNDVARKMRKKVEEHLKCILYS